MANNITIRDGNNTPVVIRTFEESTSVHNNASIPINVSGLPIFTTAAPGIVCVAGQISIAPQNFDVTITNTGNVGVSIAGGDVTASLGGGSANIGTVSISPTQGNIPVSIGGVAFGGVVEGQGVISSLFVGAGNKVYNRASNTWDLMTGSSLGLIIDSTTPIGVSAATKGFPNADGVDLGTVAHLRVANANMVFNRISNTWDRLTGTSLGLLVTANNVSLGGGSANIGTVSISPTQGNIPVSIGGVGTAADPGDNVANAQNLLLTQAKSYVYNKGSNTWDRMPGTSVGINVVSGVTNAGTQTDRMYVMGGVDGTNNRALFVDSSGRPRVMVSNALIPVHVCNQFTVSVADKVSVGGVVGIQAGTALIGAVSVRQIVSVQPDGASNWPVSIAPPTFNLPVSVHPVTQSGTWNIGALTSINSIVKVSIEGTLAGGSGSPQVSVGGAVSNQVTQIGVRDTSGDVRTPLANTGGNLLVHVCNALPTVNGITQLVSVGGTVSTQAVQIAFTDGTNARTPLTNTGGNILVHVCNAAPGAAGGSSITVSIGGAVSVQAVPIAGRDTGGDVRQPLLTTGGALIVHVSNTAPGGSPGGGSPQVSIGGVVSVQATQIAGVDTQGNARTPLLDISGAQKVGGFTTNPEYVFTRSTDTVSYAVADLVANSTVAGTVVPMSWPVSRLTGGGGSVMIRRARIICPNENRTTDRSYRLHLFNVASGLSVTNGDNGVFAPTLVSTYVGYLDIPMHLSAATGSAGQGAPGGGGDINIELASGQVSISGFLEARTSIAPTNGQIFRVALELYQD